jgi:hypothetical protein
MQQVVVIEASIRAAANELASIFKQTDRWHRLLENVNER